jgi:hypothetical protein
LTIQKSHSGLDDCEVKNRGGLEDADPKVVTAVRKAADVATLVIARTVAKTQTDAQSELGGLIAALASATR